MQFHEKKIEMILIVIKNCFDQNPFFAISKMAKNQFLNWENVFEWPEMQFHEKN